MTFENFQNLYGNLPSLMNESPQNDHRKTTLLNKQHVERVRSARQHSH